MSDIDINALSEAAGADADKRVARLQEDNSLGSRAEFVAAFLTGWRYAMKSLPKKGIFDEPG